MFSFQQEIGNLIPEYCSGGFFQSSDRTQIPVCGKSVSDCERKENVRAKPEVSAEIWQNEIESIALGDVDRSLAVLSFGFKSSYFIFVRQPYVQALQFGSGVSISDE